jgi:pimeloyl-ACP methyl ester carboxylesterase
LDHPQIAAGIVLVGSYAAGQQIAKAGNTLEKVKMAVSKKENRVKFYKSVGIPHDLALESTKWPLYALQGNAESFMTFDVREQLSDITVPCLILHGDSDIVSPLEPCGYSLRDGLPNAELEVLKTVNHCPMLEEPETINGSLRNFLEHRVTW